MKHKLKENVNIYDRFDKLLEMRVFSNDLKTKQNVKLYLNYVLNNLPSMPYVMKMCPPMTKKNWSYYEPLLAVGCSAGDLYIYQLSSGVSTT